MMTCLQGAFLLQHICRTVPQVPVVYLYFIGAFKMYCWQQHKFCILFVLRLLLLSHFFGPSVYLFDTSVNTLKSLEEKLQHCLSPSLNAMKCGLWFDISTGSYRALGSFEQMRLFRLKMVLDLITLFFLESFFK